ncbi:MAG: thiosulfate oxidation carrier protein SoxY [Salinisphaeraceae bacterium]|jgi:sulfur-oxidizing protein SoxY|nr:thiosulfate oxidation carrier protein SoxY [Salinisphaeraceae bacterium]
MDAYRRSLLKAVGAATALAAAGMVPLRALAAMSRPEKAFEATDPQGAMTALGDSAAESDQIELETPDIAENGAVVPISVTSKLPKTTRISVLVEKNPNPMSAMFMIPEGTEPFIQTRVKVAETGNIYALVEADGKLYKASSQTKVTLGGCGG